MLVAACGQLTRPARPDVPGLDSFRGPVLHSARWDHDVDLRGRRVAVVGTGASAVQIVPAIADDVAHLTVFQRSAAHVVPKPDRRYSALHRALFRRVPAWRAARAARADGDVRARRRGAGRARLRRRSARASGPCCASRSRTPACARACGRPTRSASGGRSSRRTSTARSAVRHVDLVTAAIDEVTPDGVRTADGALHPADVVVLATGFEPDVFVDADEGVRPRRPGALRRVARRRPRPPRHRRARLPQPVPRARPEHRAARGLGGAHDRVPGALRPAGGPPDRRRARGRWRSAARWRTPSTAEMQERSEPDLRRSVTSGRARCASTSAAPRGSTTTEYLAT